MIEIGASNNHIYPLAMRSLGTGEARTISALPFTNAELENHLLKVENAILRSASQRRTLLTAEEDAVHTSGLLLRLWVSKMLGS